MASIRLLLVFLFAYVGRNFGEEPFRPPAVPLIVSDPYLSVWSQADHAYDIKPTHWSGVWTTFVLLARVDGDTYLLLGQDQFSARCTKPDKGSSGNETSSPVLVAKQQSLKVSR